MIPDTITFLSHPKICSGLKALEHIPFELESLNACKPLILTSPTHADCFKKIITKALYDSNITIGALYTQTPDYPSVSIIQDLAKLYSSRGCDSIIALGSGGVVNIAKAINMVVSLKKPLLECKNIPITAPLKPLLCVPTANCIGGEMSSAVRFECFEKQSDYFFPDVIVIDARITRHATTEEIANCALSSLAHAIEAAGADSYNPINDAFAHTALSFIYQYLPKTLKNPSYKDGGVALVNAAACADIAFSNAPVGIVHTVAEVIANDTHHKQGIIMGILLKFSLAAKLAVHKGPRPELLLALAGIDVYAKTPEKERQKAAFDSFIKCINVTSKHVPDTLKELKIPRYKLAHYATASAAINKNFKEHEYAALLEAAWEGK